MFVPLFALPLSAHLILAAADSVPKLDVTPSCRGAAAAFAANDAKNRVQSCLASEQRTRDALTKDWSKYAPADRTYCIGAMTGFEPTYTELATCLEMKQYLKEKK